MAKRLPIKGLLKIAKSKLKDIKIEDLKQYGRHFSEASFQEKILAVGKLAGEAVLLPLLKGFYVLKSKTTKAGEKAMIIGALGYFIFPMDIIPDFLPAILGFGDDLMVISFVLAKIQSNITPEIEEKARLAYERIVGKRITENKVFEAR